MILNRLITAKTTKRCMFNVSFKLWWYFSNVVNICKTRRVFKKSMYSLLLFFPLFSGWFFFQSEEILYHVERVHVPYTLVRDVLAAAIQNYRKQADTITYLEYTTKGLYLKTHQYHCLSFSVSDLSWADRIYLHRMQL